MEIRRAVGYEGEGSEIPETYRVDFWERPRGTPPQGGEYGWGCDSWLVIGANDVHEVIAWAEAESGPGRGRIYEGADCHYVLHVLFDLPHVGRGRMRLAGTDPTIPPDLGRDQAAG